MQYKSVNDVKQKINSVLNSLDKSNNFYEDFKWFSKVNYTTTTEYYGELRAFLSKVLQDEKFMDYKNDLQELYDVIDEMLFSKKGSH